jgi:phosphatidylglycerophosphatase C
VSLRQRRLPPPTHRRRYHHRFVAPAEIAAFDLDGTLTRRDCVLPFLAKVGGRARLAAALLRNGSALAAAARDRERRDDVKQGLTTVLRGRPIAEVVAAGERFAALIAERWLRVDVLERLAWHREAGHEVVVVTASYAAYAAPLGHRLGASSVVATELEVDDEGVLTGRLAGNNCRGEEKVRRLVARYGDGFALGWAYGDSHDDLPMLARAQHPIRVGDELLEAVPT